jgi:phage protein D
MRSKKEEFAMNQDNHKVERRRIGQSNDQSAPQTLDQKTAACLADTKAVSDDIEQLSNETEKELAWAQRNLEREKVLALNPELDAKQALENCKLAELRVERYQNSLRLLQQKHRTALSEEWHQRFLDRQFTARQARDAASARFKRVEELQDEIIDIYCEAFTADELVDLANSDAPAGEKTRLLRTEEHCRGLENGFTRSHVSLMKETVLYDFNGNQIWPPRTSVAAAYAAMTAPADRRRYLGDASNEWWRRGQQVDEARIREDQRLNQQRDDFYDGRQRNT